jgi:hypothetical protein
MGWNRRTATLVGATVYVADSGAAPVTSSTFTSGDTTPSVLGGSYFQTLNLIATSITTFDNGVNLQYFELYIGDDLTTLIHGATLDMPGGIDQTFATGDFIACRKIGTVWYMRNLRLD